MTESQLDAIKALHATAAIVMHYSGDAWTAAQIAGLQSQFAKMGVEVVAVTDAHFKADQQVADIAAVLAQKPTIIVSAPTDPVATADAYKQAAAQGVKLVFMDNVPHGLVEHTDYVSAVSSDNYGNGVASAHLMGKQLGSAGTIGMIFHDADFYVTHQRYDAFKRTLQDDYPGIRIVAEHGIRGPDFAAAAEQAASSMLEAFPDLDGIWAVWDVPAEGVLSALRRAQRSDVIVTTIDLGLNVAIELARGGAVKGVAAQRPYDHGVTEATLAGYALLGETPPADVIFDGLAVTSENVLDAWKTIYRQEPPAELQAATQHDRAERRV